MILSRPQQTLGRPPCPEHSKQQSALSPPSKSVPSAKKSHFLPWSLLKTQFSGRNPQLYSLMLWRVGPRAVPTEINCKIHLKRAHLQKKGSPAARPSAGGHRQRGLSDPCPRNKTRVDRAKTCPPKSFSRRACNLIPHLYTKPLERPW